MGVLVRPRRAWKTQVQINNFMSKVWSQRRSGGMTLGSEVPDGVYWCKGRQGVVNRTVELSERQLRDHGGPP